jgi:hypothetical protein
MPTHLQIGFSVKVAKENRFLVMLAGCEKQIIGVEKNGVHYLAN